MGKFHSVAEYVMPHDHNYCINCGRKTKDILSHVTFDNNTGRQINHIKRSCPYRDTRGVWGNIFGSWHSGDAHE